LNARCIPPWNPSSETPSQRTVDNYSMLLPSRTLAKFNRSVLASPSSWIPAPPLPTSVGALTRGPPTPLLKQFFLSVPFLFCLPGHFPLFFADPTPTRLWPFSSLHHYSTSLSMAWPKSFFPPLFQIFFRFIPPLTRQASFSTTVPPPFKEMTFSSYFLFYSSLTSSRISAFSFYSLPVKTSELSSLTPSLVSPSVPLVPLRHQQSVLDSNCEHIPSL